MSGEREIAWMKKALLVPGGPDRGRPFELLPHEEEFLRALFAPGVRLGILSTGRKNRKTTLCAAITLCYLAGPRARASTELVSTALALKQAARIYLEATRLMCRELAAWVKPTPSQKMLDYRPLGTSYQALSADVKTKLGGGARLAIHDELGEVEGPISRLYDAIETGMVAHDDPLSVVISTQAAGNEDLLSTLIDDQIEVPREDVVLRVHAAPDGCEIDDRDGWRLANPALGVIVKEPHLAKAAERALGLPEHRATFRRYHLNQRVPAGDAGKVRWLDEGGRERWDAGAGDVAELERVDGLPPEVFGGLDLSETRDLTCLVWAFQPVADGPIHLRLRTWIPDHDLAKRSRDDHIEWALWAEMGIIETCPGRVVRLEDVAEAIVEAYAAWDLVQLRYDRWRMAHLVRIIEPELGESWIEDHTAGMGQGYASMSPALADFEEAMTGGDLVHGGHPVLRMGAHQARVQRDAAGNRKLTRKNPRHKIDGIIAGIMAVAALRAGAGGGVLEVPEEGLFTW